MKDLLGAIDEAPTVVEVDGEIVIIGERVAVAYTPAAARELRARIDRLLDAMPAEQPSLNTVTIEQMPETGNRT